jgi:hypothetical protein
MRSDGSNLARLSRNQNLEPQMHAARQAATKEMLKPDLPKRLAALRLSA